MRYRAGARGGARRGTTIVEIAIASLVFTVIAYGMVKAASMGVRAERAVSQQVVDARALHRACQCIDDELTLADLAGLEHDVDEAGFSTLTFQVPVDTELGVDWGAYETDLGTNEQARSRAGWHVCYLPEVVPGTGERRLVRVLLDEERQERFREVLVDRIASAGRVGFTAEDTGALWVVTVRIPTGTSGSTEEAVIHVASRN